MKISETYLNNRIDPDILLDKSDYITGIVWCIGTIIPDLKEFLVEEGRYFGIMLKYSEELDNDLLTILSDSDNIENYQRLLFLYKPFIVNEFKRLTRKKISQADALIIIIYRILNIFVDETEYEHPNELNQMIGIFDNLFENIRHSAKNSSMYTFMNYLKTWYISGTCGKFALKNWSIKKDLEVKEKTDLVGSGVRVNKSFNNKISEVSWTDDQ